MAVAHPRVSSRVSIVILVALCLVSRLPQLLSRNLMVDGDEAIVGLMANHFAFRHEIPLFFWGQQYGLSTIEAGLAGIVFRLFGLGPIALKVSMLGLWTIGVLFLLHAALNIVGERRAFWLATVFVLTPMWALWSMKARGGYLTSFTASSALLWLITRERDRQTVSSWFAAGVLTSIIYLAQPLWLPGLVPIVVVALVRRRSPLRAGAYVAVVAVSAFLVRTSAEGSAGPVFGNFDVPGSVPLMERQIYELMTGWFDMSWHPATPPGPAVLAVGVLGCGALLAFAVLQIYRVAARRFLLWSHLLFTAILITLGSELVFMHARDARYLLPLGAFVALLAGVEAADFLDRGVLPRQLGHAGLIALLAVGATSLFEFRSFSFLWVNPAGSMSESERMRRLVTYLRVEGADEVFCMNGLLDSQLTFYSGERVIARAQYLNERHPDYVDEVNRGLEGGKRIAVVGYTSMSGAPGCWDGPICTGDIEHIVSNPEQIYTVDGRYFAYVGADRALLERLNFRFPNP
jgi:hypothetical protein